MFHFPTFPPHTLYIQVQVTRHHSCWVSPFGHPRITARLTAPRGLSQPPTSFIGSWCQGIHRTLFITYNKDARVHCAILKQHTQPELTAAPATPEEARYDHNPDPVYVLPRKKHTHACSLRTQQYADIDHAGRPPRINRYAQSHCQCSTRELPPLHIWERNGLCQNIIQHLCAGTSSGECSLERR